MKKLLIFCFVIAIVSCQPPKSELSPEEAKQFAKEAFIFGFPIVMNYKTMYAYTLDKSSPEFKGEFNELGCEARVYTPDDKTIVTPNSDTPYCMGWADISESPLVVSVPEMHKDRFYHIQLIDMYTHNFAYIGTLQTGNEAGKFLIVTKDWKGETPEGIKKVITSETDYFMMIARVQLFDESDLDEVKEIMSQIVATPLDLSDENNSSENFIAALPQWNEGDQFTAEMLKYLDPWVKSFEPVEADKEFFNKMAKIGIGSGTFELSSFKPEIKEAIEVGAKEGFDEIMAFLQKHSTDPLASAKIFGTRSFLKKSGTDNYGLDRMDIIRSAAAQAGLYGNTGIEAIYPTYYVDAEGEALNAAENNYTITMDAASLPPVKSFWSLTMYDGSTQLLIENPLDRYLLNSPMLDSFARGKDGSITLYIQKDSPGKNLEPNWLPAPDGPFYCVIRLYGPEESALSGEWTNPPLKKSN